MANPVADSVHADDASKRTSIDVSSHPALVWSVINKIKSLDKFYFYLFLFNTYPQRVKGWQKYPADFYRETSERKFCRRFSQVFLAVCARGFQVGQHTVPHDVRCVFILYEIVLVRVDKNFFLIPKGEVCTNARRKTTRVSQTEWRLGK